MLDELIYLQLVDLVRINAEKLGAEVRARVESRHDQIEVMSTMDNVTAALRRLELAAHSELRMLATTDLWLDELHPEAVDSRVVFDSRLPASSWALTAVAQSRLSPEVPAQLVLADQAFGLLALDPPTAILVRPGYLLDALSALFEGLWAHATPLSLEGGPEADAADRALLSLLVAGLTDDTAGARLGMSRRTVARRVQRLMTATGARSRLQLGWLARERDWLTALE